MDIYKLKGMSPLERQAILEGESCSEETYNRPLEDFELQDKQAELAQACIKQSVILEEKKEVMEDFKGRLKPLQTQITACVESVKTRQETVTGMVYKISDFDNKMIHSVDPAGNVLASRPMRPEERQHSLPLKQAV